MALTRQEIKQLCKGRTSQQQKVIKYFCGTGCLESSLSDQEYDQMVLARAREVGPKEKALSKIGLDESQVSEIAPVHFEGFLFDNKAFWKPGTDKKWRTTAYQVTWIFFSASQLYVWQYTFNMDDERKKEATEEYFYKDITNFSASSETEERSVYDKTTCKGEPVYLPKSSHYNRFAIIVPGDKFWCSMEQNDYTEKSIQGMKAMLRDKKEQR